MNVFSLQESAAQAEMPTTGQVDVLDPMARLEAEFPAWYRAASDEFLNTLTHGFGAILAVFGARLMLGSFAAQGDKWIVTACGVYLFSLVGVYAMSTLSHAAMTPKWKYVFRQLDQGFIYLLIVATYTPFSLAYLDGAIWNVLLGVMWTVALVGFTSKVFFAHRVDCVSVASPLLLGWAPAVALPTLFQHAPPGALDLILGGGVCYTVGTVFLIYDGCVKHFHAVWHLCVIAGSAFHFYGLLNYVLAA